jgi:hypothetical protein
LWYALFVKWNLVSYLFLACFADSSIDRHAGIFAKSKDVDAKYDKGYNQLNDPMNVMESTVSHESKDWVYPPLPRRIASW